MNLFSLIKSCPVAKALMDQVVSRISKRVPAPDDKNHRRSEKLH